MCSGVITEEPSSFAVCKAVFIIANAFGVNIIFLPSYSDCLDCCSDNFASKVSEFKPYLPARFTKSEFESSRIDAIICSVPNIS